ncbi:ArdC-like ssDNA-binding domain-containing protein [Novosphingobium terrae]|uniref:ArdC-like ssDNA-binding domain-containing protein n=1 Tax=Novosphingobium terrae TaxID=2726189 RepID=UPI00389A2F5D
MAFNHTSRRLSQRSGQSDAETSRPRPMEELYSTMTARIVAELEEGRLPWVQPWDNSFVLAGFPRNAGTGRPYSGINSAPYRREKKEELNEQSGSLVMTCTHQINLGQKWLRPRKGRGTIACLEKAQSAEAICGVAGQGKTCMVKAILPEPQFAATYTRSGTAEWLTRYIGWSESAQLILSASRSSDVERPGLPARPTHPLYGGTSERTGHLNTSQPPTRVNAGSPKQDGLAGPAWRRSRHSTQMPGVTAGTVAGKPANDRRDKRGVTCVKRSPIGGRTAASKIRTTSTGAC